MPFPIRATHLDTPISASLPLRTGRTAAWCFLPVGARPRGALLVAHGAGNDKIYSFGPLFDAALARDLAVVSVDLPGHGVGNDAVFEPARAVEDAAEALGAARDAFLEASLPWVLVGNSLGGVLSVRAAQLGLLAPAGVAALAAPAHLRLGARTYLGEVRSLLAGPLWAYRAYVRRTWEVLPAFGPFRRDDFPVRVTAGDYLAAVAAVINAEPPATPPACPVLLLQGERDAVARLDETRAWAGALAAAGTAVEIVVLPGVGHLDVAVQPAAIAATLAFAESCLAGANNRPLTAWGR